MASEKVKSYAVPEYLSVAFSDRSEFGEMEVSFSLPGDVFDRISEHLGKKRHLTELSFYVSVKDDDGREITIFRGRES